jgi:hypothetical protein
MCKKFFFKYETKIYFTYANDKCVDEKSETYKKIVGRI